MPTWLQRLRGAIGMGVTWAIAWALGGFAIGVSSKLLPWLPWHYFFDVFDAPLPALAVPGFVGGCLFSIVLSVAARHRRFEELSVPRFALWGVIGGAFVSLIPAAMSAVGLATLNGPLGVWQLTAVIGVPLVLFSSASAAATLKLAKMGERRELPAGAKASELQS